jgi:hypothetical protein
LFADNLLNCLINPKEEAEMKSRVFSAIVVALVTLSLVGCSSALIKMNPDVKFPLDVNEKTPAFLFPINMSHLGSAGDPMALGLAVTGGVIGKFGKNLISGQQLFDLVGNLSFELAETVDAQVRNGSFEMTGSAETIATALANLMEQIVNKLVELKLLDSPIKFKYIVVLHSHGETSMGGKMLKVNSWGGIYDTETKKICDYINDNSTFANEEKALLGQIPLVYNGILEKLIQGGEKK